MFKKSKLDNGMTLVTESLPQFQSLAIGAWVNAGTRHETNNEVGLSHFLEHMMFKGTHTRSALEIAQEVDRVGGEFNAFTAKEYTCFHILLLSRDLHLATEIMADVLLNSIFDEEEIERERRVILQEIMMVDENPEELVQDTFLSHAYGEHPLGRPILGTPKTVGKFNRKDILSFFRKHYSPSDMILSVVGDISHEKVRSYFNRHFKAMDALGLSSKRPSRKIQVRPELRPGVQILKKNIEQAHLVIGFPGVTYSDPKRFAAFLLNNTLGGGMSSSLFQEIREKNGLAYSVYSSLSPFSDTGILSIYVGTQPKEIETCLEIIGREVGKLRKNKISDKALKILKDSLKGTILLNSDSVESRMSSIAKGEMFFNRYFSTSEICKLVDKVTAEDLASLAKKVFSPKKAMLTLAGPFSNSKRDSLSRKLAKSMER